jgi:hypothetical protein
VDEHYVKEQQHHAYIYRTDIGVYFANKKKADGSLGEATIRNDTKQK